MLGLIILLHLTRDWLYDDLALNEGQDMHALTRGAIVPQPMHALNCSQSKKQQIIAGVVLQIF